MKWIYILLAATSISAAQIDLDRATGEIIHNELLFSHTAVVKGRNSAFIEFMSDSCITFNPLPVNAKELYKRLPEWRSFLTWKPTRVEISSTGDFGYSTGPWEIRKENLAEEPAACGHYFSIWHKEHGIWKLLFDTGLRYPSNRRKEEIVQKIKPRKNAGAPSHFIDAEESFRSMVIRKSAIAVYDGFASNDIRIYRDNMFPMDGIRNIPKRETRFQFIPSAYKISSGNDLGYVYGIAVSAEHDTSTYLRVWRKEKKWKIAIDILSAIN